MTNSPVSRSGVGCVRISVLPITVECTPRLGKFVTVTASLSPNTPYREMMRMSAAEPNVCNISFIGQKSTSVYSLVSVFNKYVKNRKETGKRVQRMLIKWRLPHLSFPCIPSLPAPIFSSRFRRSKVWCRQVRLRIPASADVCSYRGNKRPPLSGF